MDTKSGDSTPAESGPGPGAPEAPIAVKTTTSALYATPADALKAVRDDYLYWTGRVTDTSLQLSFGVIAANWAAFGSTDSILSNFWAKSSLTAALTSLAVSLVVAAVTGTLHSQRVDYAESNLERWGAQYEATKNKRDPWP